MDENGDNDRNGGEYVSVSTAIKLLTTKFDGNPKDLQEFIDNVENANSIVQPNQKTTLLKFVLAKITGDAKLTLNFEDLEEQTWENVREKLELTYLVHRTLDYHVNQLNISRQSGNENVSQWGTRVEKMTNDILRTFPKYTTGWSEAEKRGGSRTLALIGKICFIHGIQDESVRTAVKFHADSSFKQVVEKAIEEESDKRSIQSKIYLSNSKKSTMTNKISTTTHSARGIGGPSSNWIRVKQEPQGENAIQIKCYRCQKMGHMAKDCRGVAFCNSCKRKGHETRECRNPGNRQ